MVHNPTPHPSVGLLKVTHQAVHIGLPLMQQTVPKKQIHKELRIKSVQLALIISDQNIAHFSKGPFDIKLYGTKKRLTFLAKLGIGQAHMRIPPFMRYWFHKGSTQNAESKWHYLCILQKQNISSESLLHNPSTLEQPLDHV